jgi:hypothetical protein
MRRPVVLPSLEVLDEWLYEEPAGVLRWKKDYGRANSFKKADEIAGSAAGGRFVISMFGCAYLRSRLIYKIHSGKEPRGLVDHVNRDTLDDRFENLVDFISNRRDARDRTSGDYFVVEGRRVTFNWDCRPDEDAEEIASRLNILTENYLNALHAERLRHSEPRPPAREVDEERLGRLLGLVGSTKEPDDEQESGAKIIRIARG